VLNEIAYQNALTTEQALFGESSLSSSGLQIMVGNQKLASQNAKFLTKIKSKSSS